MALNLFQNLDNLWKFAKGCESFFKMAQKGLFCTTVWYNQNSIYQKSVISWRPAAKQLQDICNDDNQNIDADFLCPKVDLLQLQISCKIQLKKKKTKKQKQQWATFYLNAEKSTV